jgi:arginyl-tRNA--protein-N-Asp/Glu arginylyltransferase
MVVSSIAVLYRLRAFEWPHGWVKFTFDVIDKVGVNHTMETFRKYSFFPPIFSLILVFILVLFLYHTRMGLIALHLFNGLVEPKLMDLLASVMHIVWTLYDPDFSLRDLPKVQVQTRVRLSE